MPLPFSSPRSVRSTLSYYFALLLATATSTEEHIAGQRESRNWSEMETYGGGTPRRETLVYRLLTPRSTHSRAQLSLLSSVPFYHWWLQEAATMRIRFVSPRASVWVNIRECHCSVCSCSKGFFLFVLFILSLFLSSALWLHLKTPFLRSVSIPTPVTFRECDTEFVDGTERRRSATTTPKLSRCPMSSHIDFGFLSLCVCYEDQPRVFGIGN